MPKPLPLIRLTLLGHLLIAPATPFCNTVEMQRPFFLQAEQAIKLGRATEADRLMAGLVDYPLYPNLLYQKLLRELDNTPSVEKFLSEYGQSRQSLLLRQHWLENLARQGQWTQYVQNYRGSENPELQCNYYLALSTLRRESEAFQGAERLWNTGNSMPASCDRLFMLWQASPSFTPAQVWKRFALALQKGNLPLADDLQRLMPQDLLTQARVWRQIQANPRLALSCSLLSPTEPNSGQIFAHAIDRLATEEPMLAQIAWVLHKNRFTLDAMETARIDRRTALALAAQQLDQAQAYLMELPNENADAQIRAWRVRAALAREDWPGTIAAIELLQPEEKKQAQWLYWKARVLEKLGKTQAAMAIYQLVAKERDYYGFNAADHIGVEYAIDSNPAPIGEAELQQFAEMPPFRAIRELLALNRETEVRSEWFHAIKGLATNELLVAAKLAQRWGLDNLAINTMAKAGSKDDLSLRFPLGDNSMVLNAAQSLEADPAMIYALVRRESAFDHNAGSPAGAMGLMQLMPSTGELMARRLNESLPSANALLDPERNLRYGVTYFKELLEKFGNHFALAASAYNAGPSRVEHWIPKNHSLPSDIWVETIPFSETRQYVAAVATYAVIYRIRLGQALQHITSLLPDVPSVSPHPVKQDRSISVRFCE